MTTLDGRQSPLHRNHSLHPTRPISWHVLVCLAPKPVCILLMGGGMKKADEKGKKLASDAYPFLSVMSEAHTRMEMTRLDTMEHSSGWL